MVEPNTYNRCADPLDGNWAAPGGYTNYAWHGYLLGADVAGPGTKSMATWLDDTLSYGFGRTTGVVPPTTFGGYPGEGFYSTAYNAGYGAWGLASTRYRDESILAAEFMLANDQAGPYAWWGGSAAPADTTPWIGNHPSSSGGSSPHSWGISLAAQGLIDSLASQMASGTLIVGRGVPDSWLAPGQAISVSNFPTTDGHRLGFHISSTGRTVTLTLNGTPVEPVLFELPAFVNNIASTSTGQVDQAAGIVKIPAGTRQVTVGLRHLQLEPAATSLRVDPAGAVHVAAPGTATVTATFADSGPGAVRDLQLTLDVPPGWHAAPVGGAGGGQCRGGDDRDRHVAGNGPGRLNRDPDRPAHRGGLLHRQHDGPARDDNIPGTRGAGHLGCVSRQGRGRAGRHCERVGLWRVAGNVKLAAAHRRRHHVGRAGHHPDTDRPALEQRPDHFPGAHAEWHVGRRVPGHPGHHRVVAGDHGRRHVQHGRPPDRLALSQSRRLLHPRRGPGS